MLDNTKFGVNIDDYLIILYSKIVTSSSQPELSIDNVPIEKVTSVKSLGISIDENLRLQTHISIII